MKRISRSWWLVALLPVAALIWLGTPNPAVAACAQALPTDKGQASYSFTVSTAGTYRVWARLYPTQANNNGIYIQIDDTLCRTVLGHNNAIPAGQLTWVDYGNTPSSKVNVTLAAGGHQMTIAGYDPSVGVDKILLLADTGCVPAGDGANCTPAVTPTPAPGGGTTPAPSSSPGATPAPSPTPVAVGSSQQPLPVSGVIKLSPSSTAGNVSYKLNGKPVSGNSIDTTKLPDGTHVIEEITTNPDGTTSTKKQTIKVENGWQYKVVRFVKDHPVLAALVVLAVLLVLAVGVGLFGPRPYLRTLWSRYTSGPAGVNASLPPAPGKVHPTMPPLTVYPDADYSNPDPPQR